MRSIELFRKLDRLPLEVNKGASICLFVIVPNAEVIQKHLETMH